MKFFDVSQLSSYNKLISLVLHFLYGEAANMLYIAICDDDPVYPVSYTHLDVYKRQIDAIDGTMFFKYNKIRFLEYFYSILLIYGWDFYAV